MRLIDANFLISEIESHNDMTNRDMTWTTWQVVELLKNCPLPPNDPLTLKELQGMDGEPVWVIPKRCKGNWCIVKFDSQMKRVRFWAACGGWFDSKNYGTSIFAYRRKLEEQKDLGGET